MIKILLVEDDIELASLVSEYLTKRNFEVIHVDHGNKATSKALELEPDLVILDLMLPGKDGISICKEIRAQLQMPILMLTASDEPIDHVLGLEVGADDFVNKPIQPRILVARIEALLRRVGSPSQPSPTQSDSDLISAGKLNINTANRDVSLDSLPVKLNAQEFDLLELLAENAGNIISRDFIFQTLKGYEYDGQSRFVDILISSVRHKLNDSDGEIIKTVRGKGYLLVK
ncbi:MAG: response regulator transcription factor [Kangiellaceae bacterium]|nr:response regulator transcription factor [Kangiellaceae bacterium]MCW8998510.1 response regulator transcription factor [Kangiellaceae bacterium]